MRKNVFILLTIILNSTFLFSQYKTENIALVTLDGMRWQEVFNGASEKLLNDEEYTYNKSSMIEKFGDTDPLVRRKQLFPFLWSVVNEGGQIYGNRKYGSKVDVSNNYWFSYPGYSEILCGYADKNVNSNHKINNPNITFLEFINNHDNNYGKLAVFGSWDVLPYIVNEERSNIYVNCGYQSSLELKSNAKEKFLNEIQFKVPGIWGNVRFDAFTQLYAFEYLKTYKPKVIYIAFGETDDFAHNGRYDQYLLSANRADAFIAEIWQWIQHDEQYRDKTTLLITTDHGRGHDNFGMWKSHGRHIRGSGQTWFAIIGPDTSPLGEVKTKSEFHNSQYASTLSALLGYEFKPVANTGDVIVQVIKPVADQIISDRRYDVK